MSYKLFMDKTVLLVEDDLDLSTLYKELLTSSGYEVYVARDKDSASSAASDKKPSFILLDVMLAADTNGLDFLEKFKKTDKGRNTPVVVLTNVAGDKERQRALKLGAKEYIVKAAKDPKDIIGLVKKYTSEREN